MYRVFFLLCISGFVKGQDGLNGPSQLQTQLKVKQLIEKKAEYHRLTDGQQDGYRIKIHFGVDKDASDAVRTKFAAKFPDYITYREYQQPNFVVLVGDYRSKLEAFAVLKKVQGDFPNAFIVKDRVNTK